MGSRATSPPSPTPPGLYLGTAGIAWALDEIGQLEPALRFMEATSNHPLLDARRTGPQTCSTSHQATGQARWLNAGRRALEFDLRHAVAFRYRSVVAATPAVPVCR